MAERDAVQAVTVEACAAALVKTLGMTVTGQQKAMRAIATIPPHVAAARVLLETKTITAMHAAGRNLDLYATLTAIAQDNTP